MKISKLLIALGAFTATLLAALAVTNGSAFAAARTWDGGGSDDNFSTAANWDTDTAPVDGDSIVLPNNVIFSGCTDSSFLAVLNNDLNPATVTLAGLSVTGEKPEGCYSDLTIAGNIFKMSGDISGTDPDHPIGYLYLTGVELMDNIELSNVYLSNNIVAGSHNLTFKGSFSEGGINGSGQVTISSEPGGSGGGGGGCLLSAETFPISGDSSNFSGSIIVGDYESLFVGTEESSFARHASSITVNAQGSLTFQLGYNTDTEYNKPITFAGGTFYAVQAYENSDCAPITSNKKLTISSDVTLTADTEVGLEHVDVNFAGSVTGKEHLKLNSGGFGSLIFSDGSIIKSELKVVTIDDKNNCYLSFSANTNNTKLVINADCSEYSGFSYPESPFETSGILGGTGKVGHIMIMNGGTIAPGLSPGTLTTGNITWEEGGNYEFEIGKDGADKIVANGTVTLGNGNLKVLRFEDYAPKAGDVYTIIENDGTDAVTGTFKDLPEGATFTTADGAVYKINYGGGDGNDVILTVVGAPKVPNTGFELLKNNPIATLLTTTAAATIIIAIAKKRASLKA